MRTLQYANNIRTPQQPGTDTIEGQQYQELPVAEHAYNKILIRKLIIMIIYHHMSIKL